MEKQTRRSTWIVALTILVLSYFVNGVEVSSQIDLDSQENAQASSASPLKAFLDLDEDTDRTVAHSRSPKSSAFRSDPGSEISRCGDPKRRRSSSARDDSTKQPTVINNIRIVVNGNETTSGSNSCKNGICDISVSSKPDDAGNIVTDVHLSVVTKLKKHSNEAGDIPVFDGFRGVENTRDRPPNFSLINRSASRPHFYNDIPQIQTRRQDPSEIWFQNRRTFRRPHANWYYQNVGHRSDSGFQGHRVWPPNRPVVDDKIEPPLSKTNTKSE